MIISLIVAVAENGVISKRGTGVPWRLRADMHYFQTKPLGQAIIVGRKSFQAMGRALPGCLNVVLTRNRDFAPQGVAVAHSVSEALAIAKQSGVDEVFVGGGELYPQFMSVAKKLYITLVHARPEGDGYFKYRSDDWEQVSIEKHQTDGQNEFDYDFIVLQKR